MMLSKKPALPLLNVGFALQRRRAALSVAGSPNVQETRRIFTSRCHVSLFFKALVSPIALATRMGAGPRSSNRPEIGERGRNRPEPLRVPSPRRTLFRIVVSCVRHSGKRTAGARGISPFAPRAACSALLVSGDAPQRVGPGGGIHSLRERLVGLARPVPRHAASWSNHRRLSRS